MSHNFLKTYIHVCVYVCLYLCINILSKNLLLSHFKCSPCSLERLIFSHESLMVALANAYLILIFSRNIRTLLTNVRRVISVNVWRVKSYSSNLIHFRSPINTASPYVFHAPCPSHAMYSPHFLRDRISREIKSFEVISPHWGKLWS
jgi:hypothetical protein